MKITFLLPYSGLSGGIRVVAEHARRLQVRGHDVLLISSPYRYPRRRDRVRDWVRRTARRFLGQVAPSHLNDAGVPWKVLAEPRQATNADVPDGDVVIGTWWRTADAAWHLAPSKGAKVFFVQGYERHGSSAEEEVNAVWARPMLKIAVSQWLADIARAQRCDGEVILVPNAVDTDLFTAPPRGRQTSPVVGFLYDAKHYRGCDIIIDAIDLARAHLPTLRVLAFGTERPSSQLPLPPGAEYRRLPAQSELPGLYGGCDVWLFGSREEGFGLPILEAMACRTPVIATPAGAAPQLLESGGGELVAHDDPQAMADAIVRLVSLPEAAWRGFSDRALEQARSYTWEDATDRFEAALSRAVQQTVPGQNAEASRCGA